MLDDTVRLTKSGKPVWLTQEIRFNAILSEMSQQGYTFALSMEDLKKNKFFIARSAITINKRIESAFRTNAQREKALNEWYRYEHLHDSIEPVSRDRFECQAIGRILGNVTINL